MSVHRPYQRYRFEQILAEKLEKAEKEKSLEKQQLTKKFLYFLLS